MKCVDCLCLLIFLSPLAYSASTVTLEQLESVQAQNELLKQEAMAANLKKQITTANQDNSGSGTSPSPLPTPASPTAHQQPEILSIYGRPHALIASIELGNGASVDVKAGEPLSGTSYTVKTITSGGVWVTDGTTTQSLAFVQ
jgi:type IV pilus biogenesis protein PilP